jgi:hypothetical protein
MTIVPFSCSRIFHAAPGAAKIDGCHVRQRHRSACFRNALAVTGPRGL